MPRPLGEELTCDQSGSSFSCAGLAISLVTPVIICVSPIILESWAGGLSGSLRAHASNPAGTRTLAYHMYRVVLAEIWGLATVLVVAVCAVDDSFCNIFWARSLRAALKAARSSKLTARRTTPPSENRRAERTAARRDDAREDSMVEVQDARSVPRNGYE